MKECVRQKLIHFYQNHPHKIFVYCLTAFLHLFILFYSLFHRPTPKIRPEKKLSIQTFVLEKPQSVVTTSYPQQKRKALPESKPSPTKKSEPKKISHKKAPVNKVLPSKKPSERQKLLQEMQESIAKIEANRDNSKLTKEISVPKPIGELKTSCYHISSDDAKQKTLSYYEILTEMLKENLSLPAYGTVKVKLTVDSQGFVTKLETIYSDSEVNRLYLEKYLPMLELPKFIGDLSHVKQYCFSLIFCSDEF